MNLSLFVDLYVPQALQAEMRGDWLQVRAGRTFGINHHWEASPAGLIPHLMRVGATWLPRLRVSIDLSEWGCGGCGWSSFVIRMNRTMNPINRPVFEEQVAPFAQAMAGDRFFFETAQELLPLVAELHSPSQYLLEMFDYIPVRRTMIQTNLGMRWRDAR